MREVVRWALNCGGGVYMSQWRGSRVNGGDGGVS